MPCCERMEQGSPVTRRGNKEPSLEKMERDRPVMRRWNKDPGHEKMDQGFLSQKMEQGTYDTRRCSKDL